MASPILIRGKRSLLKLAAVGPLAALVSASPILLLPSEWIRRFAGAPLKETELEGLWELRAETLQLIRVSPPVGCGLGAYESAFLRFKASAPLVTAHYTHSDYLHMFVAPRRSAMN